MQKVGSRELKNRLGRYLSAVRKGQSLLITDRGRTIAKLSPPDPEDNEKDQTQQFLKTLEQQGFITLATKPFRKIRRVAPLRPGKLASQMIIEDRR